jgi:hypothetical protein
MRSLLFILLTGLFLAACAGSPERVPDAHPMDAEIQQALALWHSYDMPVPPADYDLVTLVWPAWPVRRHPLAQTHRFVAFASDRSPYTLFDGVGHQTRYRTNARFEQRVLDSDELNHELFLERQVFCYSLAVPMGLHCWERGERALARSLLERAMLDTSDGWIPKPKEHDLLSITGTVIIAHWLNEALRGGSDRHAIHARLLRAKAELDVIRPGQEWDTEAVQDFIDRLGESLAPSNAEPGSPEYFIDALVDDASYEFFVSGFWNTDGLPDVELLRMGFDAVPALIAHLDDRRLSRIGPRGPRAPGTDVVTVGARARVILKVMSNRYFTQRYRAGPSYFMSEYDPEVVHEWWREAGSMGESAYLLRMLREPPYRSNAPIVASSLLALRHPDVLADAYPQLLHEDLHTVTLRAVHWALVSGELEPGLVVELLRRGSAEGRTLEIRHHALKYLKSVDSDLFTRLVLEQLNEHSGQSGEDGEGLAKAQSIVRLAMHEAGDEFWSALLSLARRSEPRLRSRILTILMREAPGETRDRANATVAEFMEDPDVWYIPEFVDADTLPRGWDTTIGMAATRELASHFGITTRRNSDEDWDEIRALVRQALARTD